MARNEHVVGLGRWLTPDPMGGDLTNPQSLNRYAYALNNPETLADPSGLTSCTPQNYECGQNACSNLQYGQGKGQCLNGVNGVIAANTQVGPTGWDPFEFTGFWDCPNGDCSYYDDLPAAIFADTLQVGALGATIGSLASLPQTLAPNNGCNARQAVNFIQTHEADAATVAQQLNVPTQNILGLSGIESQWGRSNAATEANNFFGLHGGANAPFATGVWYTSGGVAMSSFPSYLTSAQSFAAQYGNSVQGIANPTAFAQALVNAGFNPGKLPYGNPNFVPDTAGTINATAGRMQCP
jgi:Mannosyl-glycoprotein endo-beta-N-acetylglucosaminidase